MAVRRLILDRLKAGDSLEDIRKDHKSGSSLYKALTEYFVYAEDRVKECQKQISDLNEQVNERSVFLEELGSGISSAQAEMDDVEARLMKSLEKLRAAKREEAEISQRLRELRSKLNTLLEKGVDEEVVSRIGRIDFGTGDELLERISNVEKYQNFREDMKKSQREHEGLKTEIVTSTRQLEQLKAEVASSRNALDEVKRRTWMYEEANDVVQGFIKEGYELEILLSLLSVLNALAVKGEPKTSINRLIDGLNAVKKISDLEVEIRRKIVELSRLQSEVDTTTATLMATKDVALKEITRMREEAVKQFKILYSEFQDKMKKTQDQYDVGLIRYQESQVAQLETFRKQAEEAINRINKMHMELLQNRVKVLESKLSQYENAIRKWGEQKQEQGRLGEALRYGSIIHEILERKKDVKEIPVEIIERFTFTIFNWVSENIPDLKISPPEETVMLDPSLRMYSKYRILALLDMLSKYFSVRASGGNYEELVRHH